MAIVAIVTLFPRFLYTADLSRGARIVNDFLSPLFDLADKHTRLQPRGEDRKDRKHAKSSFSFIDFSSIQRTIFRFFKVYSPIQEGIVVTIANIQTSRIERGEFVPLLFSRVFVLAGEEEEEEEEERKGKKRKEER